MGSTSLFFKVFNRLIDVPLIIHISLLMPLTYLLCGGGGGGMVITKVTRHGYSFTGIFVYIYFLEVEMPDGGINGGI